MYVGVPFGDQPEAAAANDCDGDFDDLTIFGPALHLARIVRVVC